MDEKKKKRGRKSTSKVPKVAPKKRGRKPKGGKIVAKASNSDSNTNEKQPNIILHLKCNLKDLDKQQGDIFSCVSYVPDVSDVESFNICNHKQQNVGFETYQTSAFMKKPKESDVEHTYEDKTVSKDTWNKLRDLKVALHNNDVSDKKSGCFWCTCAFDNPPVYIPREERNGMVEVYGCFCSPECAVAYLKKEPIDSSTLWERYTLLNNIYSKVYKYEKNIKPAPNPYYTLDKYYGNLTIQEYRSLLKNERLLLVVDKPLTKVLPEMYEENNELPSIYTNLLTSGNHKAQPQYRLQRKQKKVSKKNILNTNFNFG